MLTRFTALWHIGTDKRQRTLTVLQLAVKLQHVEVSTNQCVPIEVGVTHEAVGVESLSQGFGLEQHAKRRTAAQLNHPHTAIVLEVARHRLCLVSLQEFGVLLDAFLHLCCVVVQRVVSEHVVGTKEPAANLALVRDVEHHVALLHVCLVHHYRLAIDARLHQSVAVLYGHKFAHLDHRAAILLGEVL